MPKKNPLQGEPIQGVDDNTSISKPGYSGKIPVKDFMAFEEELFGMAHGTVSLTIAIRDGQLQYSRITKEYTTRACYE